MDISFNNKLIKTEEYSSDEAENDLPSSSTPSSSIKEEFPDIKDNIYTSPSTIFALHQSVSLLTTNLDSTTINLNNDSYSHLNYFNDFNQTFNIWSDYSSNNLSTDYNFCDGNNNNKNNNNDNLYSTIDNQQYEFYRSCKCIIDVSTPATLERDFYAWLNV